MRSNSYCGNLLWQSSLTLLDPEFVAGPDDRKGKCFFVAKDEIVGNDYDLSINKYKTVEYVAEEFPPTGEIMAEIDQIESEIATALKSLKEML